ncbi:DUF1929-domain-containing protein [Auricularia subglabra TFB-10046 SS5]|nr:DUF1929-domain-containing protein [Auricularia subglabra TFB-10046 SS5]
MITRATLALALAASMARAQAPGSFKTVGNTLVSAMMMFLGNDEKVYILDKAQLNAAQINNHPAWGSVWDIATNQATTVDVVSNSFCASGFHLPNGSWVALGGNNPVSPGPVDYHGPGLDPTYQDMDGRNAIRIVTPCNGPVDSFTGNCLWYDDPTVLSMMRRRWYSTAEALATGEIFIIGGMVNGGYINRPGPNPNDPITQNQQAENTLEFYPRREGYEPQVSPFLVKAGGLNTYAHAFLLKSGKLLMQANISTVVIDTDTLQETDLPDMPNGVVRVYPASAGVAMLPLTPENNYNPTILFCGGSNAYTDYQWGGYGGPNCNSWEFPASSDCQRLTPEPEDGSPVAYEEDDQMIIGRSMGQFIILPDATLLMINGAANGTAGYTTRTPAFPVTADLPYGLTLATDQVLKPAIYFPDKPKGQRWSDAGLQASTIPRMYHSSAILLPDGSVFVAGSNPNADVGNQIGYNVVYPAEYTAEIWYPPYWGKPRPEPESFPSDSLTYGGDYFDIKLKNGSYPGTANGAAAKTKVVLIRSGFTTHAMNMGQRYLQLNNSYTVDDSGDITLHVSQLPPNPNLFTPGPAVMYIVTDGVPSVGKHVMVGNGQIGEQARNAQANLPPPKLSQALRDQDKDGDGKPDNDGKSTKSTSPGILVAAVAGGIAAAALLGALIFFICRRKRQNAHRTIGGAPFDSHNEGFAGGAQPPAGFNGPPVMTQGLRNSYSGYGTPYSAADSDANLPFQQPRNYEAAYAAAPPPPGAMRAGGGHHAYESSGGGSQYYDPYRGSS